MHSSFTWKNVTSAAYLLSNRQYDKAENPDPDKPDLLSSGYDMGTRGISEQGTGGYSVIVNF